ncbi:TetR/AcrR family transcriptional regulator [Brevibacterium permense]|uniref:TetR/AcrR family transcriptional regulator n=1 Tax=Brevibacterium permense TaxID=234834 RepID=UPI0021CF53C2|nr:TetR/AcrR family transcriptional regulator [Brevibacterium permense]MCU4295560.1 TetR/AcrR family transcriptional regulator [Brevibacterium permense]
MSKRDEIIAAAIRLAEGSQPGHANLSVRAVAKEAGVGPSTLRHYFPTQSDLHEAVMRRAFDTVVNDFSISDTTVSPADRLYECCAQFLPNHEHRDLQLEAWFGMHLHALGPERRGVSHRLLEHAHEITYDALHRWLNQLAREGHIDPDAVKPAATLLFTTIDGLSLHAIIKPETTTVDVIHEQIKWTIDELLRPERHGEP